MPNLATYVACCARATRDANAEMPPIEAWKK